MFQVKLRTEGELEAFRTRKYRTVYFTVLVARPGTCFMLEVITLPVEADLGSTLRINAVKNCRFPNREMKAGTEEQRLLKNVLREEWASQKR